MENSLSTSPELEMSHFKGTRKQIQWAGELRAAFFTRLSGVTLVAISDFKSGSLNRYEAFTGKSPQEFELMLCQAYREMAALSDPQYWIDHRDRLSPIAYILSN